MKEVVEIVKASVDPRKNHLCRQEASEVNDAFCQPKPLQKPHPPITIGEAGEKFTLKVTAQYADRADFGYFAKHRRVQK